MAKTLFTVYFRFLDTGERATYAIAATKPDEARSAAIKFYAPRLLSVGKVKATKVKNKG
jgi:hypothetical protein